MSDGPRWPIEGRGWPNAAHSRFVDAGGLRWHVQVMGTGPALLLLHGTGAATHSWRDLAPLLAQRFTLVMPDLPGHGFTSGRPGPGLTLPGIAAALRSLLEELAVAPALTIGHSAGAAIGLRMVLDGLPVQGIVGLAAALQPFPGMAGRVIFPTLARLLFLNPFASHIFAGIARQPGETRRFLARSTGSRIDDAGADFYGRLFARAGHCAGATRMMAEWDLVPLAAALPRIAVPLLLIHGDKDAAIAVDSARRSAAAVPGARLELLPGLGHLLHEEEPARVARLIEQFAGACGVLEMAA